MSSGNWAVAGWRAGPARRPSWNSDIEIERPSFARRSGLREGGWTPCPAEIARLGRIHRRGAEAGGGSAALACRPRRRRIDSERWIPCPAVLVPLPGSAGRRTLCHAEQGSRGEGKTTPHPSEGVQLRKLRKQPYASRRPPRGFPPTCRWRARAAISSAPPSEAKRDGSPVARYTMSKIACLQTWRQTNYRNKEGTCQFSLKRRS